MNDDRCAISPLYPLHAMYHSQIVSICELVISDPNVIALSSCWFSYLEHNHETIPFIFAQALHCCLTWPMELINKLIWRWNPFDPRNSKVHTTISQMILIWVLHYIYMQAHREATGTVSPRESDHVDPVAAAEEIAFCKACARFGLGLYLYHED